MTTEISKIEIELAALRQCMRTGDVALFCKSIEGLSDEIVDGAVDELNRGVHDNWLSEDEVANLSTVLSKELDERL